MLLRQRTVALDTLADSDPRGSTFLKRNATGSEMYISYQIPIPIGAPSSEFTGCERRYIWSMRISRTWHFPRVLTRKARGPSEVGRKCSPGSSITPMTLPKSTKTLQVFSFTTVYRPKTRARPKKIGTPRKAKKNVTPRAIRKVITSPP
jgi:hypothetical protein